MIKSLLFSRGAMNQPVVVVQLADGRAECRELTQHEIKLRLLELAELLVETDR